MFIHTSEVEISEELGGRSQQLGREPRSDERLRARRARQSHLIHDVTYKLTWSSESRRRT